VAALAARQTAAFNAQLSTLASTTTGAIAAQGDEFERRMAGVPEIARALAEAAAAASAERVTADLDARFTAAIAQQVAGAESRLTTRLLSLESALGTVQQMVPALVGDAVREASAAVSVEIGDRTTAQIAAVERQLQLVMAGQVRSAVDESLTGLDARIATAVGAGIEGLQSRVDDSITAATKDIEGQVATEVSRQMTAADVDGRIAAAVGASTLSLQNGFATQLADQQARLTTAIGSTAGVLRGEFAASLDTSLLKAREELLRTLDDRMLTLEAVVSRSVRETVAGEVKLATREYEDRLARIETSLSFR
jgi:hypothetical protein